MPYEWHKEKSKDWMFKRILDLCLAGAIWFFTGGAWKMLAVLGLVPWYGWIIGTAISFVIAVPLVIGGLWLRERVFARLDSRHSLLDAEPQCDAELPIAGSYAELSVAWETARANPENSGTADEQLAGNRKWPQIQEYACVVFGHPHFDQRTWERLAKWLETYHGKRENDLHSMRQTEIVRLLKEEAMKTQAGR